MLITNLRMQVSLNIPESQINKICEVFDCKPTDLTKVMESMILDWLTEKTDYGSRQLTIFKD